MVLVHLPEITLSRHAGVSWMICVLDHLISHTHASISHGKLAAMEITVSGTAGEVEPWRGCVRDWCCCPCEAATTQRLLRPLSLPASLRVQECAVLVDLSHAL
jgi:hypothetical protein